MPSKAPPTDLPIRAFATANKMEAFLSSHHSTAPGFYLKLAKKSCDSPSVSGAEAVETALCYGWIDGQANGFDDKWWLVRYTPRRPKSIWSKKNVTTVERLLGEGRMRPAGIAAVEAAKADGRWERAYAGSATIQVPDDFAAVMEAEPVAATFFKTLNKTDRYSVLWRVQTAPTSTRKKRIKAMVQMLTDGQVPGAAWKAKGAIQAKNKEKQEPVGDEDEDEDAPRKRPRTEASAVNEPEAPARRKSRRLQ